MTPLERITKLPARSRACADFTACCRLEKIRLALARRGILLTAGPGGTLAISCSDRLANPDDLDFAAAVARRAGATA